MRLSHLAIIKINFPDADFWLIRKGSSSKVGKPVKAFKKEHIGIKVDSPALNANYLYYCMLHLYTESYWVNRCYGSLLLQHIKVEDVKNIETAN